MMKSRFFVWTTCALSLAFTSAILATSFAHEPDLDESRHHSVGAREINDTESELMRSDRQLACAQTEIEKEDKKTEESAAEDVA